MIYKELVKKKL